MGQHTAIVIGAGIVGLATARALALKGYRVTVIERNYKAVGASIRNFGMIWPVGQPEGNLYERALRSKSIWKNICDGAGIWYNESGSLHLAYDEDEWTVLKELYEVFYKDRPVQLLSKQETATVCAAAATQNLLGAFYSKDEMIVNAPDAIAAMPEYLTEKYGVEFLWGKCVSYISETTAYVGNAQTYEADVIFICSGADFETLYPEEFAALPLTKCKLQMMRLANQTNGWKMGAALCGGLSLIHYNSFKAAASLQQLKHRYENEMPEYLEYGIHVMACQNNLEQITVGDSHEYDPTPDPFDRNTINQLILDYLQKISCFKGSQVIQSWNGIYPKLTNGDTDIFLSPEQGVYILNGLGGAGMTLSFGLAEEIIASL